MFLLNHLSLLTAHMLYKFPFFMLNVHMIRKEPISTLWGAPNNGGNLFEQNSIQRKATYYLLQE